MPFMKCYENMQAILGHIYGTSMQALDHPTNRYI